jgi:hypothetical protein
VPSRLGGCGAFVIGYVTAHDHVVTRVITTTVRRVPPRES